MFLWPTDVCDTHKTRGRGIDRRAEKQRWRGAVKIDARARERRGEREIWN